MYLNLAPEGGYDREINYSGAYARSVDIDKKFYIYSRGKMYGSLVAQIRPYYRDKAVIVFNYVMNLENGRELTIKKQ